MPVVEREWFVEIAEVTKVYRSGAAEAVEAVSSVSFSVPRGQFVAVLGPSGCGKSTLLMMVGGLESVTAGRIAVGGMPITGPRTSIGIMFQDSTLLPWKSAFDNVLFPIRILKRPLDSYRDGARSCWNGSASTASCTRSRMSCRAGCASASRSAGRWSTTPSCS